MVVGHRCEREHGQTRWLLRFVACSVSLVATAAQEVVQVMSGAQMRVLAAAMDADADGLVSREEAAKVVRSIRVGQSWQQSAPIMDSMDTNKDGSLSLDELKQDLRHFKIDDARKEEYAHSFGSFDDDGDGLLSSEEALPLFNFMFPFQNLDTSPHDGKLNLKEFKAIAAPKLAGAAAEEVRRSNEEAKTHFAALDADGDRRLNAKEHFHYASGLYASLAALDTLFRLADTNADASLSANELVEVRGHAQFGGGAAYHHSKDWIEHIERAVEHVARTDTKGSTPKSEL